MNRLVIIGNGFDLAHGLPTGYCDFIDWYWKGAIECFRCETLNHPVEYSDNIVSVELIFREYDYYGRMEIIRRMKYLNNFSDLKSFIDNHIPKDEDKKITFKNSFFECINYKKSINNWVDIENEYYSQLKQCLNESDNAKIKKLNQEFEQVKKLLEQYLTECIETKYNMEVYQKSLDILTEAYYTNKGCDRLFKEFQKADAMECNKKRRPNFTPSDHVFQIDQVVLLNFNYTSLLGNSIKHYDDEVFKEIQIHGKLNDPNNKINFGFGDEMDDDYKAIEKKGDNEYLRNIKSFAYLNTPNYKETIDFLELDKFQVYIMGHSCGLSDRILLNKIFEHKNCCSIKIYYHQDGDKDNYTDIAQNISRHFNKKEMMRERIVNKTLCEPLPQTQLPLK